MRSLNFLPVDADRFLHCHKLHGKAEDLKTSAFPNDIACFQLSISIVQIPKTPIVSAFPC
jgi:hypothetical protein